MNGRQTLSGERLVDVTTGSWRLVRDGAEDGSAPDGARCPACPVARADAVVVVPAEDGERVIAPGAHADGGGSWATLSDAHLALLVDVWAARHAALAEVPGTRYVLVTADSAAAPGHACSAVTAFDALPPAVADELRVAGAHLA